MTNDIFYCSNCNAKFSLSRVKPGTKFKCSKCKTIVQAPELEPEPEPEPEPVNPIKNTGTRMISSSDDFSDNLSDDERQLMSEETILDADSSQSNDDLSFLSKDFEDSGVLTAEEAEDEDLEETLEDSGVLNAEAFDEDIVQATVEDSSDFPFNDSGIIEVEKDTFEDSALLEAELEEGGESSDVGGNVLADSQIAQVEKSLETNFQNAMEDEENAQEDHPTQPHARDNFSISSAGVSANDSEAAAEAILKGHPLQSCAINQLSIEGQHLPSLTISNSRFSSLELKNVVIEGDFRLSEVNCAKNLQLTNVTIKGEFVVHGGIYSGNVQFQHCRIYRMTQGSQAEFNGGFSFTHSQAHDSILMTQCKFAEKTEIHQSQILQECSLKDCHFAQGLSLDGSLFKGILDLETASFAGPISLRKTIADYLNISPISITKPLQSQQEKNPQANLEQFAFLLEHFRRKGNPAYQDWAFRNYQKSRRKLLSLKNPVNWLRRPLDWVLLDLGMGYGTRPFMTLLNVLFVFIAYTSGYFYLLEKPSKTETTSPEEEKPLTWALPPEEFLWVEQKTLNQICNAIDYSLHNIVFQSKSPENIHPFLLWIQMSQALLNLFLMFLFGVSLHRGLSR